MKYTVVKCNEVYSEVCSEALKQRRRLLCSFAVTTAPRALQPPIDCSRVIPPAPLGGRPRRAPCAASSLACASASSFLHVSSSAASAFFSSVSASNSAGVGAAQVGLEEVNRRPSPACPAPRTEKPKLSSGCRGRPDSRYLRNAPSSVRSPVEGTRGIPGSEGQSRRFGANETARNREPEDAGARGAVNARNLGETPRRRLGALHGGISTLTDRRSGRDAGCDASEGTRTGFGAKCVHHEWHTRGVSPENTHESSAPARARGAVHVQKLHREASSGFARHEGSAVDAAASPNATEGDGPRVSYHID